MALLRDPASPPTPDWLLDDLVARAPTGPTSKLLAQLLDLVAHFLIGRLGEVETPVDLLWGASDRLMTLDDTVEFFNLVLGVKLTAAEKADLLAFLRAL